jgi:hypothetical protein
MKTEPAISLLLKLAAEPVKVPKDPPLVFVPKLIESDVGVASTHAGVEFSTVMVVLICCAIASLASNVLAVNATTPMRVVARLKNFMSLSCPVYTECRMVS